MNPADLPLLWLRLGGSSVLGALLVADESAVAQTWFSQPLPAGVLAGVIWGDPLTGLALGVLLQLLSLGNLPVGQTFVGERATPVLGLCGAALASGWRLGLPFVGPDGDTGRMGWLLLGIVLGSIAGNAAVTAQRRWHTRRVAAALRSLRDGRLDALEGEHVVCLLASAVRGAAGAVIWWGVGSLVWIPLYDLLPARIEAALALLPWFAPAVATGTLVDLYGSRAGARWIAAGLVATLAAAWALTGGATP